MKLVRQLATKYRFFHWELEYADLFHDGGGFDLILGNPPWIKIEWNEGAVMGDVQPLYVLRDFTAPQLPALRAEMMVNAPELRTLYLDEYAEFAAAQAYLNAEQNYPALAGAANTFKVFVVQSWYLANQSGTQGFLHPEGIFDDPAAGNLRQELYPRLRFHFQFSESDEVVPGDWQYSALQR